MIDWCTEAFIKDQQRLIYSSNDPPDMAHAVDVVSKIHAFTRWILHREHTSYLKYSLVQRILFPKKGNMELEVYRDAD